jgi:hypothetical protein
MKKLSFIIGAILLSMVSLHYNKLVYGRPMFGQQSGLYELKVHRIVPEKNIYLIYAKNKDGRIFKIISEKQNVDSCNEIKIGCSYHFDLRSRFNGDYGDPKGPLAGIKYVRDPHVTVFDYYGVGVRLEGDSINDLFTAKNIKGLCFLK